MKSLTRSLVAVGWLSLAGLAFFGSVGCAADEPLASGASEPGDDVGDPEDEDVDTTSDEVRVALARAQSLSASGGTCTAQSVATGAQSAVAVLTAAAASCAVATVVTTAGTATPICVAPAAGVGIAAVVGAVAGGVVHLVCTKVNERVDVDVRVNTMTNTRQERCRSASNGLKQAKYGVCAAPPEVTEHNRLTRLYNAAKGGVSCSGAASATENLNRLAQWCELANGREQLRQYCYCGAGDKGHYDALVQAVDNIRTCTKGRDMPLAGNAASCNNPFIQQFLRNRSLAVPRGL